MTQENEKLISGEDTQPEEPMTPGGNSRIIDDPFVDEFDPGTLETVTNQDFVKHGAAIQESFGSNSAYEVNLQKGKLFFTQHLFTAEGLHLPASFSVVYNQRFADINYVHGQTTIFKGWKLNYQQFINFVGDKCVYVDGAFKEHVFEKSTNNDAVYLDVSTQSGTILRPVSGGHEIFDGANTTLLFQSNRLVKVTQTKGSTPVETTITYDTSGKVSQVTDGLSKTYTVNYASDGITITDSNNVVLATLTADSNNCLASVDYYEDTDSGKVCQFTYYPSTYLLSNVRDQFAQEKAVFAYYSDGKFGTMGRYVIKGETSTEVHNKHIIYNTDHTIVAQSNGSIYEEAQIRYKYTFNADGSLVNACEIDSAGNAIGKQTFVEYDNGVERHVTYESEKVINLMDSEWPVEIDDGVFFTNPVDVCNKTILIPNPNNNTMDVTFSWHIEYEDSLLLEPDSPLIVELLVNYNSVYTYEYPVEQALSMDKTYTVTDLPTTINTNIVLRVTSLSSSATVQFSNIQVTYRPYLESKKELFIKHTYPSDITYENTLLINESVGEENNYWYPVHQPQFIVDGVYVVPTVFTINDYTKTMQSYFLTGKYNFYYNDCNDVIYQATTVSLNCEDQYVDLIDAPLAILTKSIIQDSFTQMSINEAKLKISQRRFGEADEFGYSQLDSYLRPIEKFCEGLPIQTYQYDDYGNLVDTFVGGMSGLRETNTMSTNGQQLAAVPNYINEFAPKTLYTYNSNGILSSVKTPLGQITQYEYENNKPTKITSTVGSAVNENVISYDNSLLSTVSHNDTQFSFTYDSRNNISGVQVEGVTLVNKQTTYSINGSYCTQLTYANGYSTRIHYDKYGRVIQISEGPQAEHILAQYIYSDVELEDGEYDPFDANIPVSATSKLRIAIDNITNTRNVYKYDTARGYLRSESDSLINVKGYDSFGRINVYESLVNKFYHAGINRIFYSDNYSNNIKTETTQVEYESEIPITTRYTRDDLNRLTATTVDHDVYGHKYTYGYKPRKSRTWMQNGTSILSYPIGSDVVSPNALGGYWLTTIDGETSYISEFREYSVFSSGEYLIRTDAVEYDANGNITKYGNVTYQYDGLNRLVRENNLPLDKTITWCYDVGGNIVSKTEYEYTTGTLGTPTNTFAYVYDQSWKDQLVEVKKNGVTQDTINYDQVGNPTSYKGATLTWARGKLLSNYTSSDNTCSVAMTYDVTGQRKEKLTSNAAGSTKIIQFYDGNNLVQEEIYLDDDIYEPATRKTYLYNSQGLVGFAIDSTTYTYRKNLFGDIISIYNGQYKVAEYKYDAWGNCTITLDTDGIGTANPFRYRGYYWDSELQLYYIQHRYYDPQTGRFISAAKTSALNPYAINGLNLYSHASNNPINIAYNALGVVSAVTMASTAVLQDATYNTENYRLFLEHSLNNALNITSNVFSIIGKLDGYKQYGGIADSLGWVGAIVDGVSIMYETGDGMQAFATAAYDIGTMYLAGKIGRLIGGAVGGIPGAIIGVIVGMALDAVFQYFTENIVSWIDDAWDAFREWVLGASQGLSNA